MILGERINLRLMRERDLNAFIDFSMDLQIRGALFPQHLTSETDIRKRFSENGYWSDGFGILLVVDKQDDRILGSVHTMKTNHYFDAVELGYIMYDPSRRGQGIMTEAVKLATDYLFTAGKMSRIQIMTEPGNAASIRVAEKSGFLREGVLRGAFIAMGKQCDLICFGITRADWDKASRRES